MNIEQTPKEGAERSIKGSPDQRLGKIPVQEMPGQPPIEELKVGSRFQFRVTSGKGGTTEQLAFVTSVDEEEGGGVTISAITERKGLFVRFVRNQTTRDVEMIVTVPEKKKD